MVGRDLERPFATASRMSFGGTYILTDEPVGMVMYDVDAALAL